MGLVLAVLFLALFVLGLHVFDLRRQRVERKHERFFEAISRLHVLLEVVEDDEPVFSDKANHALNFLIELEAGTISARVPERRLAAWRSEMMQNSVRKLEPERVLARLGVYAKECECEHLKSEVSRATPLVAEYLSTH